MMLLLGCVAIFLRFKGIELINSAFALSGGLNLGLLTVNIIGSFLIGAAYVIKTKNPDMSQWVYLVLMVGFLGAFTTYSSYSLELLKSFISKDYGLSALSFASHNALGFLGCYMGYLLAQKFYHVV